MFSRFHIQPTFCSPNHHHRFYLHPCLRFQFAFHPFSSFYLSLSLSFLSSSFFYFLWTVGWPAGEFVTGTCTRKMDPGILVSNPRPFIPQILLLPCLGDDRGNGRESKEETLGLAVAYSRRVAMRNGLKLLAAFKNGVHCTGHIAVGLRVLRQSGREIS